MYTTSDFSSKLQSEIASLSTDEKGYVRGSLECIVEHGKLSTSAPISEVEAMLQNQLEKAKAENAWDKCPIDSDEWDTLQEAYKLAAAKC